MKLLTKLLRCKETPKTNLAMVSKAKRSYMVKKSSFVIFFGKVGHETHKFKDSLKRATHQRVHPMLTSTHMLTKKMDPKRFGYLRTK